MTKVMVTACMAALAAILLLPCGAAAFDEAQLDQLKTTQKCPACDLTGADLFHADLFNADLFGANLTSANLNRANLGHANLAHANLSGANLTGADIKSIKRYDWQSSC